MVLLRAGTRFIAGTQRDIGLARSRLDGSSLMETVAAARQWADARKSGWEALDPEPILERYAADAVLSTEPFREPYRGREGVRAYVARVLSEEE
ncbi:MAG TPA: hypothetical protein VJ975_09400, partial [Candidatus Limnocylindria bacterium]|nr:hypothetical protein [Candidatus Limnocylindria bacterium]